ncbi:UPF0047 protein [Porphyridium purpureum]|uniref:UPF0047 protein n=1 Tax=Porphyridium purpureum TaxID=35688 RepID=A0A5J4YXQ2_PORPP|nr:UPF0047 protein [Porphyridium purpureum]|eukprot:POR3517..scf208_2
MGERARRPMDIGEEKDLTMAFTGVARASLLRTRRSREDSARCKVGLGVGRIPGTAAGTANEKQARCGRVQYASAVTTTMAFVHEKIGVRTSQPVEVTDLTARLRELCKVRGVVNGILTVSSLHTTCAIFVNENEMLLNGDVREFLASLVPASYPWQHNLLERRPACEADRQAIVKNNYGGYESVELFMQNEPINAHAHVSSMILGNSTTVAVVDGELMLGTWQSVMFVDFDGPRDRNVQVAVLH